MQMTAFLPIRLRPSPRPTLVVVLPSPAGVGLMARLLPGRSREPSRSRSLRSGRSGGGRWVTLLLVGALALVPTVWAGHLLVSYALVPPSCDAGTVAPLHLTTIVAILIGAAATWWAARTWRRLAPTGAPTAVLALVAAALGVYFTVVIAMVGLTPLFQSPCH